MKRIKLRPRDAIKKALLLWPFLFVVSVSLRWLAGDTRSLFDQILFCTVYAIVAGFFLTAYIYPKKSA